MFSPTAWVWVALSVFFLLHAACSKFEGTQEIPAYIRIDSVKFTTNYITEGTSDHKLVDAWIYVNDQLIGGFELPAEVPVLHQGMSKVEIRAGVKLNGIAETRAPNPCMTSYILQDVILTPDSVTIIHPVFEYLDNAEFVWMEDFEDASLAISLGNSSDTGIYRTPENFPGAFVDEYSSFSGIAYLDSERSTLELESNDGEGEGFVLDKGDFVFLEMNWKSTVPILVGLYIRRVSVGGVEDRPFIVINKSEDWNKIYINLTPIVNDVQDAVSFKIYFLATKSENESDHQILFDNIKLITRPNL